MKTLLSFLMTIFCAALVCAAEYYIGSFTFPTGNGFVPVCYEYASYNGGATPGVVDVPLAKNEIFRVCLVRDKRGANVNEYTAPAVAVDAAGQLVCADCGTADFSQHRTLSNGSACAANASGAKWMTLRWTENLVTTEAEYIVVGDVLGAPADKLYSTVYGFNVFTTEDVSGSGGKVYMYLVAMDTRTGEGVCEGVPAHVKSYAMALCYGADNQSYINKEDSSPRAWYVNATGGILVFSPGLEIAWKPRAEITSLVVDGETLTGKTLATYLKPNVSQFATSAEGLTLTATAPDVQYYTLYTKEKLSDTAWTSFEEFVANDENLVDKINGKSYTRFRIGGESPSILQIPLVSGEASRFYMLRGE